MAIAGHSMIGGNGPNFGMMVVGLKPYEVRRDTSMQVAAILKALQPKFNAVQGAQIRAFNLPAIPGVGMANGFDYRLQNAGGETPQQMEQVMYKLLMAANQNPEMTMVYSTFNTATPQLFVDLDRVKAQILGVNIKDVFSQLQSTLGYSYINDFTLNGRIYKVNMQGREDFRSNQNDVGRLFVRNNKGEMVPMRSLLTIKSILGPQILTRYNNTLTVKINGSAAAGSSSTQAMNAMEKLSMQVLPKGYAYEWTGMSLQEKTAGGQTTVVLILAFLFAYLFLVALYESWMIPIPVLLSVSVALMGAMVFLNVFGLVNNVYAQIGFILLDRKSVV